MFQLPPHAYTDARQWLADGVYCDTAGTAYRFMSFDHRHQLAMGIPVSRTEATQGAGSVPIPADAVHLHWPLCGAVNSLDNKLALYVQRIPARQYRRTYAGRQVQVTTPRMYEALTKIASGAIPIGNDNETIRALFYPWYPDNLREALRLMEEEEWFSVALTRRITLVNGQGKALVYDGQAHVGYLYDGVLTALVSDNHARKLLKAFHGEVTLC